eukprot:SAG11_NODE_1424_length_4949_cov_2.978763_4_plen_111_part_00
MFQELCRVPTVVWPDPTLGAVFHTQVASCRWCQMYTHDLWWVASIHTKIFRSAPKPCIRRAGGIGLKCGIDEPLQLTSEQLNQICMSNGQWCNRHNFIAAALLCCKSQSQ